MGVEHLILFNLALLAAWISPGPAMLVAMQETLRGGRRAGIAAGLGLALISPLWTLAALLGLDALFTLFPWAYGVLRVGGALYLLWIAYQTWAGATRPLPPVPEATRKAFRRGLVVNLANPKSVLFAAAVLVVIFPPDLGFVEAAIVAANHFVLEFLLYALLATALSTPAASRAYMKLKVVIDRVSATVMGALGLRLLMER